MRVEEIDVLGKPRGVSVLENEAYRGAACVPAVSLVVCSRNRASSLGECLRRIREVRCHLPWELVLVDNGSADHTREVMLGFIKELSTPAVYLFDVTPGNAAGRNLGFAVARSDVVAFIDDDCYIANDHLASALRHFRDPGLGFCTGRTMLYDPEDYPITIIERVDAQWFFPGDFVKYGQIAGANMVFRKKALLDVGGFDELFGAGTPFACEDWEVSARASDAGWSGGYFPDMVVWHHHKRKRSQASALKRYYEFGAGAAFCKLLLAISRKRRTLYYFGRHFVHHIVHLHPVLLSSFIMGAASYWMHLAVRRRRLSG
jgi:glycosyltransferase involved in cell wall biosynthesis